MTEPVVFHSSRMFIDTMDEAATPLDHIKEAMYRDLSNKILQYMLAEDVANFLLINDGGGRRVGVITLGVTFEKDTLS